MYRELYARELARDPWRNIIWNSVFVLAGIGLTYLMISQLAADGCLQMSKGGCITAHSDPGQFYLIVIWFPFFTILGVIGLIYSIRALPKKRSKG